MRLVGPGRMPRLAGVAAALIIGVVAVLWWDRYVERALARWAVGELLGRSDSTYRLQLADLSFMPLTGSLAFDSATIATDTSRNRGRRAPLPGIDARGVRCRLAGVNVPRLLFRRSFDARVLGCERLVLRLALPPDPPEDGRAPGARERESPLGLSAFRIASVAFPSLSLTLERLGRSGNASVALKHTRFGASDLELDLTADPAKGQGVSAARARVRATGLVVRPDSLTEIAVAGADAELTDSTVVLSGVKYEPAVSEQEWVRRKKVRDDRITFALDSLDGRGVRFREFIAGEGIGARALELRGARLTVTTDKRLPKGPPERHRTPQEIASRPGQVLHLDSVLVTGGRIVYREREPKAERAGEVRFDGVQVRMLDLHLPHRRRPLRITMRARLMNQGPLTLETTVPLDAAGFDYELSGRLGRMPAEALNSFLAHTQPFKFDKGVIENVVFEQSAKNGRALSTVTPRYHDLSVEPTGDGGSIIGKVAREVVELVAETFVVRSRNPDEDGKNLRTARTVKRYDPTLTWVQFVWFGLRDAARAAMKE